MRIKQDCYVFQPAPTVLACGNSIENLMLKKIFKRKKDSGFFSTTKKGEVAEWGASIRSSHRFEKRDGIKRIIAAMTVGKDVSSLFGDVIKCTQVRGVGALRFVRTDSAPGSKCASYGGSTSTATSTRINVLPRHAIFVIILGIYAT